MSGFSWTKEQSDVIYTRNCNVLVSAAAGSGKTAVLVERIIQIVTDTKKPVDVDNLLVVTFTNAAAAEMRERIGDALAKKVDKEPENRHLQRQLTLLHRSSITTIHSFCLNIIKKYFHVLDLDPTFKVGDETEILLLKSDVLQELLEERYAEGKPEFYALVESYSGGKNDKALEELILTVYSFIQSNPWPKRWLHNQIEKFNIHTVEKLEDSPWIEILKDHVIIQLEDIKTVVQYALQLCKNPQGPIEYSENMIDDIGIINDIIASIKVSFFEFIDKIKTVKHSRLKRCGKEVDESLKNKVKEIRDKDIKDGLKKLKTKFNLKSSDLLLRDMNGIYPVLNELGEILIDFTERFTSAKREKCIIDFNDIEHYALNILLSSESTQNKMIPSEIALTIQKQFEEILIDEYQDSNLVQEAILTSISKVSIGQPNIFMVGDVKQSIYKFRSAKPQLFLEKYNTYHIEQEGDYRRIDLFKNFRSRKEVIEGCNYIFRQIMSEKIGEVDYDDKAALYLGAEYKENEDAPNGGPVELHLMEQLATEELEDESLSELNQIQHEAKLIAQRIKNLMIEEKFNVYDKKIDGYRPLKYRDIVILLRATSQWANVFMEQFTEEDIPVYADMATGYFDAIEVKTVLALLEIIDNPRQDIPLLSVLRSPMFFFLADELTVIRVNFEAGDYYEALIQYVDGEIFGQSELGNKIQDFLGKLEHWRELALYTPIDELIWQIIMETDYYHYIGAMAGGKQRQANIKLLIDKAENYERSSYKGLFDFIRFIEKVKTKQGDMGAARIMGENDDIVRMMSIHKSKGLEFPVVFIAGLGKQFNEMDVRKRILLHQDLGFGPDYVDFIKRVSYKSIAKIALAQKIKIETLSEEMRILYVAFTRAREKLILVGTVKKLEDKINKWSRTLYGSIHSISPSILSNSRSYFDWIVPSVMKHPDGLALRERAGISDYNHINDSSRWKTYIWNTNDMRIDQEEKQQTDEFENILNNWDQQRAYSEFKDKIEDKLLWTYKYNHMVSIPVKISVTEMKKRSQVTDEDSTPLYESKLLVKPNFMEEKKGFTAVEKGTILHYVMRHLNFNDLKSYESINSQLFHMVQKGIISEREKKTIFMNKIIEFGKTSLVKRINQSINVKKEIPFVIGLPIEEVFDEIKEETNEQVMIQGVIDCYFEENDKLILVDYKTDYVTEENIDVIKNRYEKQLQLYGKALEQLTGKEVVQKILYLFSINKEFEM